MEKILNNLDSLVAVFYEDFFKKHPEIKSIFRNSQLEKQQKELKQGLELIFKLKNTPKDLNKFLEDLGIRHVTYEVTANHYQDVKDSLGFAFKETFDDDYSPKNESDSRELIDYICERMLDGAKRVSVKSQR